MSLNYCIRPMTLSDLADIMLIEKKSAYKSPWSYNAFYDALCFNTINIVITMNKKIIGFGILSCCLDEAEILNICIGSAYQHQGFGDILLKHLIHIAKDKHAKNLFLDVRKSNKNAIALYEKNGFEYIYKRKNYYVDNLNLEDALIYRKHLL